METISLEEAARRLRISREEAEEWLRSGAIVGTQVEGRWQIDPSSLIGAHQVRETQADLVEEGYLNPEEIADTTLIARDGAVEDRDDDRGDEDRGETIDASDLARD